MKTISRKLRLVSVMFIVAAITGVLVYNQETVLNSMAARSATPGAANPEGWASQTGFRKAETNVQKNLVNSVLGLGGQSSGQSVKGGDWEVDTDGGDGGRMRTGINDYHKWYWTRGTKVSRTQIRAQMINDMGTTYTATQKGMLADQIMQQYDLRASRGPFLIPTTDADTLFFLAIRKQCREFVSTKVLAAGGTSRTYGSGAVSNAANYRPGMGLYKKDKSHAMIIMDIKWDKNGNPISFKVAEANYGSGWSQNPPGMVPWQRTIGVGREISVSSTFFNTYYVVSFG